MNFRLGLHWLTLAVFTVFTANESFSQSNSPCNGGGAPNLAVNATCSYTTGTTVGLTEQTNANNFGTPSCGSMGEDGWYSFTAPASGSVTIDTQAGSITDLVMALYSATPCNNSSWAEIACDDDGGTGTMPTITQAGLTPGTTYYIRMWEYGGGTGTFDICITENAAPAGCAGDIVVNSTLYSAAGLTTCGFGDDYSSSDACGSSYMNGDDIVIEWTPTTTECVDVNLTNTGTWVGVFITDDCPNQAGASCLASNTNSAGNPSISSFNVTAGTTYYITVSTFPAPQCSAFDIDIVACPPPPVCAGDIVVNSTLYSAAGLTTCGFGDDFSSTDACGSSYMGGDDIVIEWTPTTSECVSINLSNTDTWVGVFLTDDCPNQAGATCLSSNTNSAGNPSIGSYNVTAGVTYYITVSTFPSPQCTAFDIDIVACPPPPVNDDCSSATVVPVNPIGSSCATTVPGTIQSATASSQANSCGGALDDDDVWFEFVATSTDVDISLNNVAGTSTDLYHSVWDVGCSGFGTATALVCSDPNTSTVGGLTIGNTYLVRVYSFSSTSTFNTTFDICINETPPCGASSSTEDNCPYPAQLTQGVGTWSSSTYPYYTADTPANSGTLFCGSVENNSWYQFTALNTTETFDFTAVDNCVTGWGIQAEVYEVTQDAQGCCTNFTSMSNCWNDGTATTGTVTATGLTIGNTYVLMVDGWGGDNCDFTVSNWTATGIQLPVELVDFEAAAMSRKNVVMWKTVYEENNDYFNVMRSFDGVNFETIDVVDGAGDSQQTTSYLSVDYEVRTGPVYYKLEQIDFDGSSTMSKTIVLNRSTTGKGILAVYPNPTKSILFIDINPNTNAGEEHVDLLDSRGLVVESITITEKKFTQLQMNLEQLASGVYFIRYVDSDGITYSDKVIKK